LINSGAGIQSRFYDRFAAFLAENGVPTVVYDYRGIGRSRPSSLRGFEASVEIWGSKDCAAVIDWLVERFPGAERLVVGHSVGGFVTGFATNGALIDQLLLVSAHTGYWQDYASRARFPMFLLWHVFMPAITRFVGYFPGRRLRISEDLPRGVALEWAARRKPEFWWHLKKDDGSIDNVLVQTFLARFEAIRARTLALQFADDPFATDNATARILGLYKNACVSRLILDAADGDGLKIGHFGFFRSRFRVNLWPRVLNAVLDRSK
jgi:predicted alpha/beta hydrolase